MGVMKQAAALMAMPMTKGRGLKCAPRAMGMTRGTMMAVVAVLDMMLVSTAVTSIRVQKRT